MQFRQIILEAGSIYNILQTTEIDKEQLLIKINKLESVDDPISQLEAQKKYIELETLEKRIQALCTELSYLSEFLERYPDYTPEDIEQNQNKYWESRLTRQAKMEQLQAMTGVSSGNLQSLVNAGIVDYTRLDLPAISQQLLPSPEK